MINVNKEQLKSITIYMFTIVFWNKYTKFTFQQPVPCCERYIFCIGFGSEN